MNNIGIGYRASPYYEFAVLFSYFLFGSPVLRITILVKVSASGYSKYT